MEETIFFLFLNVTKWVTLHSEDKTEKKNRIETLSSLNHHVIKLDTKQDVRIVKSKI